MEPIYTYYISLRKGAESFTVGVDNTEAAYDAWRKACDFAEAAGIDNCDLIYGETGEVVAWLGQEYEDDDFDQYCDDASLEMGFDPYEGTYTWDC